MSQLIRAGFFGIGNMGSGMAYNLARAVDSLYLFDVDRTKAEAVQTRLPASLRQKVRIAKSVPEVAQESDVVCLSLTSEATADSIVFGNKGVLNTWQDLSSQASKTPKMVIDHSTFSRDFMVETGAKLARDGVSYLDAPVSGGPEGASSATLTIMVGGPQERFDYALPLLRAMGSRVIHVGGPGAGIATKLVNQLLVGIYAQGACEAIQLGLDLGLKDVKKLMEVLSTSWGNSLILQKCGEQYLRAEREGFDSVMHSAAPLRNLTKDFECIAKAIDKSHMALPCTQQTLRQMQSVNKQGFGEADFIALQRLLKRSSN